MNALLYGDLRPWRHERYGAWTVAVAGDLRPQQLVRDGIPGDAGVRADALREFLASVPGHFGFIAESASHLVAACDPVRSHPVFYARIEGTTVASNDPDRLRARMQRPTVDEASLLELLMAGYVTGRRTAVEGICQIRPGEILLAEKPDGEPVLDRHYVFAGSLLDTDEDALVDRLAAATESSFDQVIAGAAGRPIYVPLSGGLDSRLVLAMLRARGYEDINAFSYGARHNEDAQRAREVAQRLNVPWTFMPSTRRAARRMFASEERKAYWDFSARRCAIPNMQEFLAFSELNRQGVVPEDAVVVNGQSGDFISGGHVPEWLADEGATIDQCFNRVVDKHYGLWEMMKAPENLRILRRCFDSVVESDPTSELDHPARVYEYWEWQERQSKFVVNQQRTYEFFGLDWALPLWSRAYCDFWPRVPLSHRLRQQLYRTYLERWDFKGLFTDRRLNKTMVGWPGMTRVVPPIAKLVGLVAGHDAKDFIYRRMKYFGFTRHQLGAYSYRHFWKRAADFRNPLSLYAETWLRERYPDWMASAFPIRDDEGSQ